MKITRLQAVCLAVTLVFGIVAGYSAIRLYKKIRYMSTELEQLEENSAYLQEKLRQTTDYYEYDTHYKDDAYNYLAIGNSLTLIRSWKRGICSTQPDNDYYALVVSALEKQHGEVVSYRYNFKLWEQSSNRDNMLDTIDCYLSDKLDLVSIQLGENAFNLSTYQEDLKSLIAYVRKKAPKATIIVIGDWWSDDRNAMRKAAASETGCLFADLSEVMRDTAYQSKAGTICYIEDGSTIEVSEEAATHPGDKGMKYIADAVMKELNRKNKKKK